MCTVGSCPTAHMSNSPLQQMKTALSMPLLKPTLWQCRLLPQHPVVQEPPCCRSSARHAGAGLLHQPPAVQDLRHAVAHVCANAMMLMMLQDSRNNPRLCKTSAVLLLMFAPCSHQPCCCRATASTPSSARTLCRCSCVMMLQGYCTLPPSSASPPLRCCSCGMLVQGYCINPQQCKTFPVLVGDFGSPLRTAADAAFLNDLAAWLQLGGSGNDGLHAFIPGFIWNGYNNATLGAWALHAAWLLLTGLFQQTLQCGHARVPSWRPQPPPPMHCQP